MDNVGSIGMGLVASLFALLNIAWYARVLFLLVKIWLKVRHLPG